MPDPVRDDALYCSVSCKLKAQRKRKKERAPLVTKGQARSFELVAPLCDGPQLWLPFMGRGIGDGRQLSFGFLKAEHDGSKQHSAPSGKEASAARGEKKPEQRGWVASLWAKLSQPSNDDGLDII
jgi:hypothetical protein